MTNEIFSSISQNCKPKVLKPKSICIYKNNKISSNSVFQQNRPISKQTKINLILHKIHIIGNKLGASSKVLEQSYFFFSTVVANLRLFQTRISAIAAACILGGYRNNLMPMSVREICEVADVSKKKVGKCCWQVHKLTGRSYFPPALFNFLKRYSHELALPPHVEHQANQFLIKLKKILIFANRLPLTLVALALSMAMTMHSVVPIGSAGSMSRVLFQRATLRKVSAVTGVSCSTILAASYLLKRVRKEFGEFFEVRVKKDTVVRKNAEESNNSTIIPTSTGTMYKVPENDMEIEIIEIDE